MRGRGLGNPAITPTLRVQSKESNKQLVYASDDQTAREIADQFKNYDLIGFDIETAATRGWGLTNGVIRTFQLAGKAKNHYRHLSVIDLFHVENIKPLVDILLEPKIEICIHNSKYEQEWMLYHVGPTPIRNVYDTQVAADVIARKEREIAWKEALKTNPAAKLKDFTPEEGWKNGKPIFNLGYVAKKYCNIELDKAPQGSDWSQKILTARQINYAGMDGEVNIEVALALKKRAAELGPDVEEEIRLKALKIAETAKRTVARLFEEEEQEGGRRDDYQRAKLLIEDADSTRELAQIWDALRSLPLNWKNRRKTKALYRSKLASFR